MMAHVAAFSNEDDYPAKGVLIYGTSTQFRAKAPLVIRQLNPRYISFDSKSMQINCGQMSRLGLYAFSADSTNQFGVEKLIDGLWLYNEANVITEIK